MALGAAESQLFLPSDRENFGKNLAEW